MASELAPLVQIAETLDALIASQAESPDDRVFAVSIDRKVLAPIRDVFRTVAAVWAEPYLGMLRLILSKADGPTFRLYNAKAKRKKVLKELAEVPVDLRKLAEMVR